LTGRRLSETPADENMTDSFEKSGRNQPTMADVAARAGVSAMTVSRALGKGGSIAESTRRRIMAAADELGYVFDQAAGTLSSKRSGFIAVLIPAFDNSNFADTTRGLAEAVESSGLQVLFGCTDSSLDKEERLIESMLRRRPEGMIVTDGRHTERANRLLRTSGVPVVETWDMPSDPIEHVVGFSNADAMNAVVHSLYQRGYRRIAFIGSASARDTRGGDRERGYRQAVGSLDMPKGRIVSIGEPPMSMTHGCAAIVEVLSRWPDTDAVACLSDLAAFGALMECRRRGWDVPGRVALAGFGDFELSRTAAPRISTVFVDAFAIGRAAGEIMLQAIEAARSGGILTPQIVAQPFRVLERESA
jgi:LacI family gluconate utilization system Gnt-I transcriptional repressor